MTGDPPGTLQWREAGARENAFVEACPPTVDRAKRGGREFVRTCRRLGDDAQHHVGLEVVAAGLGFRGWCVLVRDLGIAPDRPWSEDAARERTLELLPDIEDSVLDAALAVVAKRPGASPC